MKTRTYAVRIRINSNIINRAEFEAKLKSLMAYWQSMTGDNVDYAIRSIADEPIGL